MRKSFRIALIMLGLLAMPAVGNLAQAAAQTPAASQAQLQPLKAKADAQGEIPLVVQIKAPNQGPAVAEAVRDDGATDIRTFDRLPYVALVGDAQTIDALNADPNVVKISEDIASPPALASTLPVIGADRTRAIGFTGAGRAVAILDTGIDADHPFFRDNNGGNPGTSRILSQACYSQNGANQATLCPNGMTTDLGSANTDGLANCLNGTVNMCDHGSHVAGIAAGDGTGVAGAPPAGVAPDAGIIAIQVFTRFTNAAGCNPNPFPCVLSFDSDQIAGLNRVATLNAANPTWGISAANISIGGTPSSTACDGDSRKAAVDALVTANIATVIAAGNNSSLNAISPPGCISTAITVGNTQDNDTVRFDSNRGPLLDLFAPGTGVDSSIVNGFGSLSGTSMAAPHVAGAWAVLRQASASRTVAQVLSDLQTTGTPITYATNTAVPPATATTARINLLNALGVTTPVADLTITKTAPATVSAGTNLSYAITVANNGPTNSSNMALTDTVPSGTTFVSITPAGGWTCPTQPAVGGTGNIVCTRAALAAGAGPQNFTLVVKPPASAANGSTITNTATVTSSTPDPTTPNSASASTAVTTSADLVVTKTDSPDPVIAGTNLTYGIAVANNGPSDAATVALNDTVPADTTFVSISAPAGWNCPTQPAVGAAGPISCNRPTLAAGSGAQNFAMVVKVMPAAGNGSSISNTATVNSTTTDPDSANNSASASTAVTTSADLAVTKTAAPANPVPGTNLSYTIGVVNSGPSNAQSVTLSDNVPPNTTFVSMTPPGGFACGTTPPVGGTGPINCTNPSLAPGPAANFTLVVKVRSDTLGNTAITNTATVGSTTTDPNAANNSAAATVTTAEPQANLGLTKTCTPGSFTPSNTITCTVIVSNNFGPSDATSVVMTDTLPNGTAVVGSPGGGGFSCTTAGTRVSCTRPRIAAGSPPAAITVAFKVVIQNPPTQLTNTAVVTSATIDPFTSNNTASAKVNRG